jgi:hypothetical protein
MARAFQSPARDSKERARDTRRCIGSCLSKMSRAVLLCCTALALLFSVGAAHAQQGNLPTPVQKLPSYPPVVCVAPNWRPEPCEGRHDIPQVMEEDRAQPALPLLNSRNTPRAFECIKPAEPGWLGLGGFFQLLDCTWFGWIEPYPVKPFDGKWPASQLAEPVKCLKPDGTEEPCESRHTAQNQDRLPPMAPRGTFPPLTVINNDWGGRLHEYEARWQQVAFDGGPVEIMGWCVSGCTLVAAYIPKERLCFGEGAALYFHQARAANDGEVMWLATKRMIDKFPPQIRLWIATKGGWMKIPSESYWILTAHELWKMGYSRCND